MKDQTAVAQFPGSWTAKWSLSSRDKKRLKQILAILLAIIGLLWLLYQLGQYTVPMGDGLPNRTHIDGDRKKSVHGDFGLPHRPPVGGLTGEKRVGGLAPPLTGAGLPAPAGDRVGGGQIIPAPISNGDSPSSFPGAAGNDAQQQDATGSNGTNPLFFGFGNSSMPLITNGGGTGSAGSTGDANSNGNGGGTSGGAGGSGGSGNGASNANSGGNSGGNSGTGSPGNGASNANSGSSGGNGGSGNGANNANSGGDSSGDGGGTGPSDNLVTDPTTGGGGSGDGPGNGPGDGSNLITNPNGSTPFGNGGDPGNGNQGSDGGSNGTPMTDSTGGPDDSGTNILAPTVEVPEPQSIALFAAGFLALLVTLRRQRKMSRNRPRASEKESASVFPDQGGCPAMHRMRLPAIIGAVSLTFVADPASAETATVYGTTASIFSPNSGAFLPANTKLICFSMNEANCWDGKKWQHLYPPGRRHYAVATTDRVACSVIVAPSNDCWTGSIWYRLPRGQIFGVIGGFFSDTPGAFITAPLRAPQVIYNAASLQSPLGEFASKR